MTPEEQGPPPKIENGGIASEHLTVRDVFAVGALIGILSSISENDRSLSCKEAAMASYQFAAAMLTERERRS